MSASQYHYENLLDDRHQQLTKHIHQLQTHPLKACHTVFEQVVSWGDMDMFAHLNNVRYYEYAQSARIDHLTRLNLIVDGYHTVIVSTSCQYQHSVHFPDILWIGVRVKKIGHTSLTQEYLFLSTTQNKVVAIGESVVVQMNRDGNKVPFNDTQRAIIAHSLNNDL